MELLTSTPALLAIGTAFVLFIGFWMVTAIRVVVPTNAVHVVQSGRKTISFGRGLSAGNTYYSWPAWLPGLGVRVTVLPVSVFDLPLNGYAAYDKGRLPFVLDILAFFRINDSNMAAERVPSFPILQSQLKGILQGAARTILATSEIEDILESRSVFGDKFTHEVQQQLIQWGVEPVKNIELMDIRDEEGSSVIANIMAKKKSEIEMQSRMVVAKNKQDAQNAEITATQAVQINQQVAAEAVGIRTAQKDQVIGIQTQKAQQAVADEAKLTMEKNIAVKNAQEVGQANIDKSVQVVAAERERDVAVIKADAARQQTVIGADAQKQQKVTVAEGTKQETVTIAEGTLAQAKMNAEGTQAIGLAKAAAETALQLAPVQAQVTLAKEIGENAAYQTYLVTVKQIEAGRDVGIEQAKAFTRAEVKIIANAGNPVDGASTVMDLFGAKGGVRAGAFIEALKATTDAGKALLNGGQHAA